MLCLLLNCLLYDVSKLWDFAKFPILNQKLCHSILEQDIDFLSSLSLLISVESPFSLPIECLDEEFEWCDVQIEVLLLINVVGDVSVDLVYESFVFAHYFLEQGLVNDLDCDLSVASCS